MPNHLGVIGTGKFQFHYGSVKRAMLLCKWFLQHSFQFHYGSVKSFDKWFDKEKFKLFQFHYGSVKSRCGGENDPPVSGLLLL